MGGDATVSWVAMPLCSARSVVFSSHLVPASTAQTTLKRTATRLLRPYLVAIADTESSPALAA